jgi:hypothetical protein
LAEAGLSVKTPCCQSRGIKGLKQELGKGVNGLTRQSLAGKFGAQCVKDLRLAIVRDPDPTRLSALMHDRQTKAQTARPGSFFQKGFGRSQRPVRVKHLQEPRHFGPCDQIVKQRRVGAGHRPHHKTGGCDQVSLASPLLPAFILAQISHRGSRFRRETGAGV